MSQLPTDNDDNRSVAAGDIVQFDGTIQELQKFRKDNSNWSFGTSFPQLSAQNAIDAKMEQLKDEFSKMLFDQQKQMMAQFEQKMENFRKEMDQAIGNNQMKLNNIWGHLLTKGKIIANPKGIVWDRLNTKAVISECGLKATKNRLYGQWVYATEGYAISGEQCRKDNCSFPGTIVFYFEVTITMSASYAYFSVGFTDRSINANGYVGGSPNCYGIAANYTDHVRCWLSGKEHKLECPIGTIDAGNTVGCGILLNSMNELAVFFTLNGILIGKQTPINPTVDRLYPTVYIYRTSVEANFGDNPVDKPFNLDIGKCPGLVFE